MSFSLNCTRFSPSSKEKHTSFISCKVCFSGVNYPLYNGKFSIMLKTTPKFDSFESLEDPDSQQIAFLLAHPVNRILRLKDLPHLLAPTSETPKIVLEAFTRLNDKSLASLESWTKKPPLDLEAISQSFDYLESPPKIIPNNVVTIRAIS